MSQDEGIDQQKKSRPESEAKRDFGCPCGKTYLSYPALFTHVKQKHNGKAPGELIKPKTDKARGRPKIHVDIPDEDITEGPFNLQQQIDRVLENVQVAYEEPFEAEEGTQTCQHMATAFLNQLQHLDEEGQKVIRCFLNEVKLNVEEMFSAEYWREKHPGEIIEMANEMCHKHEENMGEFPLGKETIIELMYVLFRWMYKSKWTDHKLVKKGSTKTV